jgi:hypothetical protein
VNLESMTVVSNFRTGTFEGQERSCSCQGLQIAYGPANAKRIYLQLVEGVPVCNFQERFAERYEMLLQWH